MLGITCCTTGDAFACFMGRYYPNSTEIRKGKTVVGFLGAAITTSVHSWAYLYFLGRIPTDLVSSLIVLLAGFFIGG